jgi:N utilization substance protein A
MANEILLMAEVLSSEKNVDQEIIFEAIEAALATATRKRHREDIEARVAVEKSTGDYTTFRQWEVLDDEEEIEFPTRQISLSEARQKEEDIEVGGFIEELMEPVEFGRIAAQAAKQVIMQKVREAERERISREYEPRVGEMFSGVVKRMERGDCIVDLGGVEAILPKSRMIPREGLRTGDRIRSNLVEVRTMSRGPQLVLDRICPELVLQLFQLEVPEAGEGTIEIVSAARDPGLRAKISVRSHDAKIDPVGACVGIRGSRVQSVSNEIGGERVDITKWAEDPAQFVINALAPAEVESILVDEDNHVMDVVVDETQLSQAIGRGGQNVRLASELTSWEINILTNEQASEKQEAESLEGRKVLIEKLDIDEDVAAILIQEGFYTIEEVAYVPKAEMLEVEEFDEALVDELRQRAEDALVTLAIQKEEILKLSKPAQDLLEMEGMDKTTAHILASEGIVTMEDLADCAVDEIIDFDGIDRERAELLIMTARAPWFEEDEDGEEEAGKEEVKENEAIGS